MQPIFGAVVSVAVPDGFQELLGEIPDALHGHFEDIKAYMLHIPGITYAIERDTHLWFYRSASTSHFTRMIEHQEPLRNCGRHPSGSQRYEPYKRPSLLYPRQQYLYYGQPQQRTMTSSQTARSHLSNSLKSARNGGGSSLASAGALGSRVSDDSGTKAVIVDCRPRQSTSPSPFLDHRPAYLYGYQLIGDDFFLTLALTELQVSSRSAEWVWD